MTSIPRRIGSFGIGVALLMAMSGAVSAQSLSLVVPPAGAARDAFQALEEGRYKDADAAFARALAAAPEDPALLLGAGLAARRLSNAARARELLTRALQIDPALTPASQLLGTMLYESGDLEGAIRVYDAALVRAPDQARMAARVEEWRKEAALHEGFRRTLGGHFAVLFEGPAEEEAAAAAVDILESAYDSHRRPASGVPGRADHRRALHAAAVPRRHADARLERRALRRPHPPAGPGRARGPARVRARADPRIRARARAQRRRRRGAGVAQRRAGRRAGDRAAPIARARPSRAGQSCPCARSSGRSHRCRTRR